MSVFHYKAATRNGELVTGTLDALDLAEVVVRLRSLGQVPIRIDADQGRVAEPSRRRWSRRRVRQEEIEGFTRELSTLLAAGIALDRALGMLVDLAASPAVEEVIRRVRQRVQGGSGLADALAEEEGVFSPFAVNLVRAGEAGGVLAMVLERLAAHQERTRAVRDTVIASMIYPVILVVVAVLAVLLLLTYVVPQFAELFADVGQALPLPTRIVIGAGEFLQSYGWTLVVVPLLAAWLLRAAWRRPASRGRIERTLLGTPLLGALLVELESARLTRTLATLLGNGVPLIAALRIAGEGVGIRLLAESLLAATREVQSGKRLADALAESRRWPALALQLIRVGEESGELEAMLNRIADIYDRSVQVNLKRSLALLEPALILILGVVVAGIVLSILVAILGVNQLVV